ncbi:MAG: hypothetical protein L6R39_002701 [Caloplaca ligustica]|nr:MAG: hypothetical protein L6R39_002701 [Caloplaca ligustica]
MFGRRKDRGSPATQATGPDIELANSHEPKEAENHHRKHHRPLYNHNGHKVTKGIEPNGESGRKWVHPHHFLRISARSTSKVSMAVNVLWPFVPAAIALRYARPENHLWIFVLNYIAMVPSANLIGFAGQELARKLPKVFGVLVETFLGGLVEIVLFMVLLRKNNDDPTDIENYNNFIPVIRAAILGSILANLLLCLGFCFFAGGLRRDEQDYDAVVSEVGSGLLMTAGFGLMIPAAFYTSLRGSTSVESTPAQLTDSVLSISRVTSVILFVAFLLYVWFQVRTHHSIYDAVLEKDEARDHDRHKDLKKDKLTLTECILALVIAITFVCLHAVFLVEEIEYIVHSRHISDSFMGLILVPLVEKAAEHLTAVDEAWDNQMNFALAHVLGATIQTALFNGPLVVIVGWGLHKAMVSTLAVYSNEPAKQKQDLNFEIFNAVVLILAIIVAGNFLRDGKSNYLEGALCILIYIIIAVSSLQGMKLHYANLYSARLPPSSIRTQHLAPLVQVNLLRLPESLLDMVKSYGFETILRRCSQLRLSHHFYEAGHAIDEHASRHHDIYARSFHGPEPQRVILRTFQRGVGVVFVSDGICSMEVLRFIGYSLA